MSKKLTISEMDMIARKHNGKCLSDKYINNKTKLTWECKKGHRWQAIPNNIKRGQWCPDCGGTKRLTIKKMKDIAFERGGKCMSEKYINNRTKLVWECANGHRWKATPDSIIAGRWCPFDAGNLRLSIEEMKEIASKRGGKCLSEKYVNNRTKLEWECAKGHRWKAVPETIKAGHWCPECAEITKPNMRDIRKIALSLGGRCLSKEYINAHTKLFWQCSDGHRWYCKLNSIKNGSWCPICSISLGERICREYFEQIFKYKFPKSNPSWLKNDRGNVMELDGYCQELQLAFEHQGEQHYSISTQYIQTREKLNQRKKDDKKKLDLCHKNGIKLFIVPQIFKRLKIAEIKELIKEQSREKNISLPEDFDEISVNLTKAYKTNNNRQYLKQLQQLAKKQGGKCLSDVYIDNRTKLKWECAKKHQWQSAPGNIKSGSWCPICSRKAKLTIYDMQLLANKNKGKCLSENYTNIKTKLLWRCIQGHTWEATPGSIKSGTWCPDCRKKIISFAELQSLVSIKEGRCLSKKYENANKKLLWECKKGHQWEALLNNIKNGRWCPYCSKNKKLTMEEMKKIAEDRSGKCLSLNYVNTNTKLRWQCSKGHTWLAIPSNIKSGRWCPECENKKLTISEMHILANKNGGKCLSPKYINNRVKLFWECAEKHQWEATPSCVKSGRWCPICADKRLTLDEMQTIAKKRNGICLSKKYVNIKTKLLWKCHLGHQWMASPSNVKKGSWCPYCTKNIKLTIYEMKALARTHLGKCLSKKYINNHTRLEWECYSGHRWQAIPSSVKSGKWCPMCASNTRN